MINVENRWGVISITSDYFASLVSYTASSCFGVAGMVVSGAAQGFRSRTGRELPDKGVIVSVADGALVVELHIEVVYGLNIAEVVKSIMSEVRYAVEQATGLRVKRVNVCVDAMRYD